MPNSKRGLGLIFSGYRVVLDCMRRKRLPNSIRKFIRREKSRIRRQVLEIKKQTEEILELCERFKIHENKRDTKNSN